MNIGLASSEHAEQIAALHAASWATTYSDVLSSFYLQRVVPTERLAIWQERLDHPRENQFVLVATEEDLVVGFACAFVGEHSDWGSYLDHLHVAESHHGRGVGSSLLVQVASICEHRRQGQGLYLFVNQSNERAQKFYLAFGAQESQVAVWDAPDGTSVPTFRFSWQSIAILAGRRVTLRSRGHT